MIAVWGHQSGIIPWLLGLTIGMVVCVSSSQGRTSLLMQHREAYQGKFWQITDIHWDQKYNEDGDPANMCHKAYQSEGHNSMWGNYNCDSPWPLVKSAIQAMVEIEAQPDFVLWTGDNAPHTDDPEPNFSVIFNSLSNITGELRTAFQPSIPVLPVLGNHDAFPKDDYPVAGKEFYGKYLTEGGWATLLPPEAQEEFVNGGYYSYKLDSGVMILVVNTNLYYAFNTLGIDVPDPCGQFAWLRSKLQVARDEKLKVIITAHAPPGYFERQALVPFFNDSYNNAYVDLLNDFGGVILVQIYGHEHTDSFKLFSGPKGEIESVALLAPSVTPWHASVFGGTAINPSVRLYHYTPSEILDYFQYHLNLSQIISSPDGLLNTTADSNPGAGNETEIPKWELFYQAREAYGLSSLSTITMASLYKQLESNDTLFQKYYLFNSAGYNNGVCDSSCKKNHICAIAYLKIHDVVHCMHFKSPRPHIPSYEHLSKFGKELAGNFHKSNASQLIITLVVVSMALTAVLAVVLAVMLVMVVVKRSRMMPVERSFPILDLSKPHWQNYRKLP